MVAVDYIPSDMGQVDEPVMSNPYSMVDNPFVESRADLLKVLSRQLWSPNNVHTDQYVDTHINDVPLPLCPDTWLTQLEH